MQSETYTDIELRDLFRAFDPKQTGYIEMQQFERLAQSVGFFPTSKKMDEMMKRAGIDENGDVDEVEFVALIRCLQRDRHANPEHSLADAMCALGRKGKEQEISVQHLRVLLTDNGEDRLSNDEFDEILRELDSVNKDAVDLGMLFTLLTTAGDDSAKKS